MPKNDLHQWANSGEKSHVKSLHVLTSSLWENLFWNFLQVLHSLRVLRHIIHIFPLPYIFWEQILLHLCYMYLFYNDKNNIKNKVKNDKKYILNGKIQKKIYFEFLRSQDKSWNFKTVSVIFYPIFILHMPCFYNIHIAGRYICVCKNDSLIPWGKFIAQ